LKVTETVSCGHKLSLVIILLQRHIVHGTELSKQRVKFSVDSC